MSRAIARFTEPFYFKYPRWSPDGKWIAYQRGDGVRWDIFAVDVGRGTARQLTHDNGQIHGLTWLPDSSGVVYSSSRATTMSYLPTLGLWEQSLAGGEPRRLAVADVSYLQPGHARRRRDRRQPPADAVRSLAISRRKGPRQTTCGAPSASRTRRARCRRRRLVQAIARSRSCPTAAAMRNLWITDAGDRRAAPDHLRARAGRRDGRADLVARRQMDRVRLVARQHRPGLRRVAREPGWRQREKCRLARTWRRVVARRAVDLLHRQRRRLQGARRRRAGRARSPGSDPQRDRVCTARRCISWSTGR